ncbi:hypothetical protein P3T27_006537 [Kitasatospora sp. MAA19]|uniref:hypothetical protein n=1 Tax=Kitasatospora sp. MAA19 TaxID=3035090 RepID=UPI0024737A2E|nr:hypothetical protein [Kitasatospora sp. MAA19]MDH6709788.1 hypothetical protein [Kitasatospora sp. MAA19]
MSTQPQTAVSDQTRCPSTHWFLLLRCELPRGHRDNWHQGRDAANTTIRYRRTIGLTEAYRDGEWQPTDAPTPDGLDWRATESVLNHAGQRGDADTITVIDGLSRQNDALLARVRELEAELAADDAPARLANVETLIDAAETRPLTAWEAEEVRSAPRAVRGNRRVSLRREARMQRYLTAWHSARRRARATHQLLDIAEFGRDYANETAKQLQAAINAVVALAPEETDDQRRARYEQLDPEDYHQAVGYDDAIGKVTRAICDVLRAQPAPSGPQTPALTGWAADMADAGLTPYDGTLTLDADDSPFVRVHFAFATNMPDPDRARFVTQLGRIILNEL